MRDARGFRGALVEAAAVVIIAGADSAWTCLTRLTGRLSDDMMSEHERRMIPLSRYA